MQCVTVTLNPAIDTSYLFDRFGLGDINRATHVQTTPGGKGNNVAKVLAQFGHAVCATGLIGGSAGTLLEQQLHAIPGIEPAFLRVAGETRRCLALIEQDTGRVSEVLEPGIEIPDGDAVRFVQHLVALAARADVVILSGSLPPGVPADYYAHLIRALHGLPAQLVLDTSGPPLREALGAQPDLIKPNAAEMAGLIGHDAAPAEMIRCAQRDLIGNVLAPDAQVLLSLGARGAVLISADHALWAQPPAIKPVSPVGCGDALLAGFVDARARHLTDHAALSHAVATGTAAALHVLPGTLDHADLERVLPQVQIRTLDR